MYEASNLKAILFAAAPAGWGPSGLRAGDRSATGAGATDTDYESNGNANGWPDCNPDTNPGAYTDAQPYAYS